MNKLPLGFYQRDTIQVAEELLGKLLVHQEQKLARVGRIVEVEAYLGPQDLAAHSSKGLTPRNRVLFGPPGRAYVYLIYGIHHCLNVVTESPGHGAAVLLRAIEPVQHVTGRTQGPGLLCRAMGVDLELNGNDLSGDLLYLAAPPLSHSQRFTIVRKPRIGVAYAGAWALKPLRFYIRDNPYVSRR